MKTQGTQAVKAYKPFGTKGKGRGVWGFKGEENNSQGVEKTKSLVNKFWG